MLLVQDQYMQSRKNFDSEFQLKQNPSKQMFPDSKEIWDIESGCEEEINTSGNNSEGDEILYADPSDIPEDLLDTRRQVNPRKKNVRFGSPNCVLDTSETSSFENEYPGLSCGFPEPGRRRSSSQEPEITNHRAKEQFRMPPKTKWVDCGYDKSRPQSSPEKVAGLVEGLEKRQLGECAAHRLRRRDHRWGRHHPGEYDFDDLGCRRPLNKSFKFESGDDMTRCCEHCFERKTFMKMKPMPVVPAQHKHMCHGVRDSEEMKNHRKTRYDYDPHSPPDRYCQDEYCEHFSKTKKKVLEAVQEQQEQFSDSTYKVPSNKYSSQTIPGELLGCPGKKSLDKITNSSTDWFYYNSTRCGPSGPPKLHKTRSRRTRMNRMKNGWKKALVQTVRDGSRNERVGVLVMGSKGPEFYAKNCIKPGNVPFRKSKSFLDSDGKSFEVMTIDCKNVFLSSSEPGPRASQAFNDIVCPEEDVKVEEKIARYSKNVSDIVKSSEEKFYKALSSSEFLDSRIPTEGIFKGAGEGIQEEKKDEKMDSCQKTKLSPQTFPLYNVFSPRLPKSSRSPDKKISEDSKAMAALLNEQGKQYLESQSKLKEDDYMEELKELKEKFPPKEISKETAEANMSFWGMKLEQLSEKTETKEEGSREEEEGEGGKEKQEETESAEQTQKQSRKTNTDTPKKSGRVKTWDVTSGQGSGDPVSTAFRETIENGSGMSREEFENLQGVFGQGSYNPDGGSNEVLSSTSSEVANTTRESKINVTPRSPKSPNLLEAKKLKKTEENGYCEDGKGDGEKKLECYLGGGEGRKASKIKNSLNESKTRKKEKTKEGKSKKKIALDDRMKLLRQALPSIAAENEAAHLRQLKRYIDRFIDRVEASTASEVSKRKEGASGAKDSPSTDSSEVRVDARKILDFVSNPFKKISSDVTINIAKKLTDALVQDKTGKGAKHPLPPTRPRKQSENETEDEAFAPCNASSASDRFEEPEPTYLKQLKKMRNEHLNNILLEVKRLSELLRFLDRCNRLQS